MIYAIRKDLCDCICHKYPQGTIKHIMDCCAVCPGCSLYIAIHRVMTHRQNCQLYELYEADKKIKDDK